MSSRDFIVEWKIRLPGSKTPVTFPLHLDMTAGEAINVITRHFSIKSKKFTVVISPTNSNPGRIIPSESVLRTIKDEVSSDDILELWKQPNLMKAAVMESPNTIGHTQEVVVDAFSQFSHMIPIFQKVFGLKEEFSFQFASPTDVDTNQVKNSTWLVASDGLFNQRVPSDAYILVHPLSLFEKFSYAQVAQMGIVKEGILFKQSMTGNKKSKTQKRWFVLAEGFLFYFRNKGDSAPRGVLTLEYFSMKLERVEPATGTEKKYPSSLIQLTKIFDEFTSKHGNTYLLSGPELEVQGWVPHISEKMYSTGNRKEFGVDIQQVVQRRLCRDNIPRVMADCVETLRKGPHLDQEGLFRVPGSASLIEYYKDQYDQGEEVVLSDCHDAHTIAGLLKLYMRELPEPLVTWALYDPLLTCYETVFTQGEKAVVEQLATIFQRLPPLNLRILKYLCNFLLEAGKHHLSSKMTVSNLATVFGPNLIRKELDDPQTLIKHASAINSILELMINHQNTIFKDVPLPTSLSSPAPASPLATVPAQSTPNLSSLSESQPSRSQTYCAPVTKKAPGTWTMANRVKPSKASILSDNAQSSLFTPALPTSTSNGTIGTTSMTSSSSNSHSPVVPLKLSTTTGLLTLAPRIRADSDSVMVPEEKLKKLQVAYNEEAMARQKAEAQLDDYKKRLKELESKLSKILPLLQAS